MCYAKTYPALIKWSSCVLSVAHIYIYKHLHFSRWKKHGHHVLASSSTTPPVDRAKLARPPSRARKELSRVPPLQEPQVPVHGGGVQVAAHLRDGPRVPRHRGGRLGRVVVFGAWRSRRRQQVSTPQRPDVSQSKQLFGDRGNEKDINLGSLTLRNTQMG